MRVWYQRLQQCLAALGLLWIVVTFTPIDEWIAHRLAGSFDQPSGETLIVLSGAQFRDDVLGWSSYLRCVYARDAVRNQGFSRVVILGGSTAGTPISELMAEFLSNTGVPRDRIVVEKSSLNTRQNALQGRDILRGLPGPKVLLTSDYHMFRARRVFEKAGIEILPDAVPDVTKRAQNRLQRWNAFCDLMVELTKIGYYRLRGWV